ncbi:MAG: protein phosphatase 2C domain-containing protein [Chloroflexi bacterium]|nr:protein phosphatase 2C domain-containing protein [Chloroflexota bacterium]
MLGATPLSGSSPDEFVQARAPLRWSLVALCEAKPGEAGENCDDRFAGEPESPLCAAVADGVTVGFFSGLWAGVLARQFVAEPLTAGEDGRIDRLEALCWLRSAANTFKDERLREIDEYRSKGARVARRAERSVSHSTLVGLRIVNVRRESIVFETVAVGDSCVIWRTEPDAVMASFPLTRSDEFGVAPPLIPSRGDPSSLPRFEVTRLTVRRGGVIVLATDAVAQWLLHRHSLGFDELSNVTSQSPETWASYVRVARSEGMTVDDSTALVLRVESALRVDDATTSALKANRGGMCESQPNAADTVIADSIEGELA